jgi:hypothetical protein
VNGKEIDGFYISKYENTDIGGKGYSLPAGNSRGVVGFETSMEKCVAKGPGWHLTTVQEWGAVALWCKKNGQLPHGNTDHGRDKRESMYKAIPVPDTGNEHEKGKVLTGTGPVSWSHDGTACGIWDMCGNLSEWVGGYRAVYGEIQVLPDNDGADRSHLQTADSSAWRAIDAATGAYVIPDGNGTTKGTVKLDFFDDVVDWGSKWFFSAEAKNRKDQIRRCDLSHIRCDDTIGPEARELLIAYGMLADDPLFDYMEQFCYMNNGKPEVCMYRGGYFGSGAFAGIFVWSSSWERDFQYEGYGFRASYVPL